jgi:CHAT domain-containing protein
MAQIDNTSQVDGIVLLKLATLQNADYARWVTEWSGTDRTNVYDVDFPSIGALTQLDDPKVVALRQDALGAFFLSAGGASLDTSEATELRITSLDLVSGYAALNLDGLAIFFLESAEPNLERAPDANQADVMLSDAETARYFLARGRLALKRGDAATALATVGPVVTAYIDRARLGQAGSIEDLGPWARRLQGFVELYLSALAADPALLAAEPPENILAAQQLLAAADASATSGRLAARLSAVDPDLVRGYQDGLRDLRGTMMAAASGGDASAVDAKRREVTALRERIKQIDPAFGANTALSIAPLDTLRANAAGGATVILTSLPDRLLVSTVTKAAATSQVVDLPQAEVVRAIAAFRATILREEDVATTEGALLATAVLSGLRGLPQIPDRISFVIDGPFVSLPFGALPIRMGGKQSYLGAEIPLSMTPSLALLAVRSDAANGKADRPFLGIGDAQFSAVGAKDRLGFLPTELRETNTELRFMGALLGADIAQDLLLGAAATEIRLEEMSKAGDLARYRIIAFATHGFIENQGNLREAGLLLSEPQQADRNHDGILSASEIYRLKLDADLVILSACDTGAVTTGSRGLSDLAQAFIYAGARGLIVTHWEIDTFAATELSKRLATEIRADPTQSQAVSFRNVVRSLLSDPAAKAFHHPKYWASHAVIGL